jgi:integrase/recombinase XerD
VSDLSSQLADYLVLRRSLGYKLERAGEVLTGFVDHLDRLGQDHITTMAALEWVTSSPTASPGWRAGQLGMVRCFARYAQAVDPAHEIPPTWLLPSRLRRPAPYLYSDEEIGALMSATNRLRSPLRCLTTETIIGLMAVSGIRVGEVLRLDRGDLSSDGHLAVRNSKAGKSRILPLRPSSIEGLRSFASRRDEVMPNPASQAMFISSTGTRLSSGSLRSAFAETVEAAHLVAGSGDTRLRIGDLRHSFAVKTLTVWHEQGRDVQALLPLLSAYMGHVSPASTYWYLSSCPHLLTAAAGRVRPAGRRP